jgi:DNA-binding MarR family transcriptional regulator
VSREDHPEVAGRNGRSDATRPEPLRQFRRLLLTRPLTPSATLTIGYSPMADPKTLRALQGVARALGRWGREQARTAGPELTPQQADALHLLAERGVVSTSVLADRLGIDPSTASRNLAGLERRGYIIRKRGADDGRQTDVRLTSRGKRTAEGVSSGWGAAYAKLLEPLSRTERQRLADALDLLARVLDGGGRR